MLLRICDLLHVTHQCRMLHSPIRSMSTIFALSSGQGKGGVAVVRISGSHAQDVITSMTCPAGVPPPRRAVLRDILHPLTKEPVDRGIVLWFPGPNSFTGEDCVELHVHGGPAVITATLGALAALPGYQLAKPGEFTRRAFNRGKLDLTGVEGLADLIAAETEAQRRQALRQSCGQLSSLYSDWRQQLLQARAVLEAHLDFGEEGHEQISDASYQVYRRVLAVSRAMYRHLRDGRRGELVRGGLRLALLGRPNVGKSTGLNALLRRSAAIVTNTPGTTRDVISGTMEVSGYPVVVSDTAGLRGDAHDPVEVAGISRALDSAREADAALLVLEADELLREWRISQSADLVAKAGGEVSSMSKRSCFNNTLHETWDVSLSTEKNGLDIVESNSDSNAENFFSLQVFVKRKIVQLSENINGGQLEQMDWYVKGNYIVLLNKTDLLKPVEVQLLKSLLRTSIPADSEHISCARNSPTDKAPTDALQCPRVLAVSLLRGDGVAAAEDALERLCAGLCCAGDVAETPVLTNARHRTHVTAALHELLAVLGERLESLPSDDVVRWDDRNCEDVGTGIPKSGIGVCEGENAVTGLLLREDSLVVAAHHLHRATRHLGHVTGDVTTEHVLEQIFQQFCIGK